MTTAIAGRPATDRRKPSFRQVIFDCDGVLVDSERISAHVFSQMLDELGLAMDPKDVFEHLVGLSMSQCLEVLRSRFGRAPPPEFVDAYDRRSRAALERDVVPVPGIVDALERIDLPCCVASNGEHDKMRVTLRVAGLWARFQGRVFSAEDVARPKPAPDVYLHAAERCGVAPRDCLVVEDSPAGVAAARAAGMTVFGYAALTPAHRLREAGAHAVFHDMRELPRRVAAGRPAPCDTPADGTGGTAQDASGACMVPREP